MESNSTMLRGGHRFLFAAIHVNIRKIPSGGWSVRRLQRTCRSDRCLSRVTFLLYCLIAKPNSSDVAMKPLISATFSFHFAFSWLASLSHLRVRCKVATPIAELVGAAIAFMAVVAPIDPGSPGQQFTFEANRFLPNLCMHKYIESLMSE